MRPKVILMALVLLLGVAAVRAGATAPVNLEQLTPEAVAQLLDARSRRLRTAQQAVAASEADVLIAGARPNPALSYNVSGINPRRSLGRESSDSVLRIDQPIERGDKRALRLGVSSALLAASQAEQQDVRRQQHLGALLAYFDLKAAEERLHLAQEARMLARQLLSKGELRLQAGDIAAAEVARLRAESLRDESDARQSEVEVQRARFALAQWLALESETRRLATAGPWPAWGALPTVPPAIEQRADVRAAQHRLDAAEQAVLLARSLKIRDVTLSVQLERDRFEQGNHRIGLGVSLPLFTGNDYQGELGRALVAQDQARDELERIRALALGEWLQSGFEAERLAARALQLQQEALPAARKASAAVAFAFGQGAASALEAIEARRSLNAVELDVVNARVEASKARAILAAQIPLQDTP